LSHSLQLAMAFLVTETSELMAAQGSLTDPARYVARPRR